MHGLIMWLVETIGALGYPGIFILMAMESSVIPIPSELVIPPAGFLAQKGEMNMFTVIFAIGRMPGWIANYKEVMEEPTRIYRPRQVYVGPTINHYVPIKERS